MSRDNVYFRPRNSTNDALMQARLKYERRALYFSECVKPDRRLNCCFIASARFR